MSGNCWYLAAASALAEVPGRIERIFRNEQDESHSGLSHNGIYALDLFALMMPVTITIDDRLPLKKDKIGKPFFAKVGRDLSLWSPLFEKAFAKLHGSYDTMWAGNTNEGLNTIAGSPGYTIETTEHDDDSLWQLLSMQDRQNAMITMGSVNDENDIDLVNNHAYAFLRTIKLSTGERLVQVRNPWGTEKYSGPWSD